jgi:hypothetical protein
MPSPNVYLTPLLGLLSETPLYLKGSFFFLLKYLTYIAPENLMSDGTLTFASVYLSIIDILGVNPLDLKYFLQRLFASITSNGTCTFCASAVAPCRKERHTLYSSLTLTVSGITLGHFFWTRSRIPCSNMPSFPPSTPSNLSFL